jgi:hypothetical protein
MAQSNRRGRPPLESGKAKRASFNTRLRPNLKLSLESAAREEGRSLSEEIEFRLERSLEEQRQMGAAISLGIAIGGAVIIAFQRLKKDAQKTSGLVDRHKPALTSILELLRGVVAVEELSGSREKLKEKFPSLIRSLEQLQDKIDEIDPAEAEAFKTAYEELQKSSSPIPPRKSRIKKS